MWTVVSTYKDFKNSGEMGIMGKEMIWVGKDCFPVYRYHTIIVGSGAAGFNSADSLWNEGERDIAIVTDGVDFGTSRNTGSDKQTYYKLTLAGSQPDSIGMMAKTLFDGMCVDGDHALCEAALSVPGFLKLCALGVPFPQNRFGEYVGYKTDHDPSQRATSVGPYTSKLMTEALERSVLEKGIPIRDGIQVVQILQSQGRVMGFTGLDIRTMELVVFQCANLIYAVGGPAGIYASRVYPESQLGASGIAFEAGMRGKNVTEWQYGLASLSPRWNVSGTYMQVIPRVISTDEKGGDKREFLQDFFHQEGEMLSNIFMKGYQWPFDVRKIAGGSSIIDILVYLERCKGRRVYLDFTRNPGGGELDFAKLSDEARTYLDRAGACFGTPIDRLKVMNRPAADFYLEHGVDLSSDPLEIALCAQHNNGGLSVDSWWQTNIKGMFAVGEAAGTHGVYRPGGSALNAGQVGSARAARYIAQHRGHMVQDGFQKSARDSLIRLTRMSTLSAENTLDREWEFFTRQMDRVGGAFRKVDEIDSLCGHIRTLLEMYPERVKIAERSQLPKFFRLRDILLCQLVYLSAMKDYAVRCGVSRGSALYYSEKGEKPYSDLPESMRFLLRDFSNEIQEVSLEGLQCRFTWRLPRPIPQEDNFFENVWRGYRENMNVY